MITSDYEILIADNAINEAPTAMELADITVQMAAIAKSMGYAPRIALLSFSNFGNTIHKSQSNIQEAIRILDDMKLDFEYDGEMSPDVALNPNLRKLYPFCKLSAPANVLIMPNLHAAAISTQLLQELTKGAFIGPILNGFKHSVQIVQIGAPEEQIVKSAAFAALDAVNNEQYEKNLTN